MNRNILVENEMPSFLQCKGSNYEDTKRLSMKEVSLFIERDIHFELKKHQESRVQFSMCLIKKDTHIAVRVNVPITENTMRNTLKKKLENILWSYNYQHFIQKNGQLFPEPSRFQFYVTFN